MLLHHLDPILRKEAHLGDWQVISPSEATGQVHVVESLRAIAGQRFEHPVVIVAQNVYGDEEPPEGVQAVITSSSVDLVSHVAVRTRNAHILFASCYDRACFDRLRSLKGKRVHVTVNVTGDVLFAEATEPTHQARATHTAPPPAAVPATRAKPILRCLGLQEFDKSLVGGKSWRLKLLAEKLPDWIGTPRSVAFPFGVFRAVLQAEANHAAAARYAELLGQIQDNPKQTLWEIRQCLSELQLPQALQEELRGALQTAGLALPTDWPVTAARIKQVWASMWNDRAYFSRQTRQWPHDAVEMAVLVQEVVEAEYAFVIHTVNPTNRKREELYAEVVLGLGETLVGNYPGRALSFICNKSDLRPAVLAYPSKSLGLYGGGLIFRSDSNSEDLAGYAGAGLYDSVLLQPPREVTLDYTGSALVWDEGFRDELLRNITRIGGILEQECGAPQDIEGAFSKGRYFVVQTRPQVGLQDEVTRAP
jgi:alpha-glucan,water dikinase